MCLKDLECKKPLRTLTDAEAVDMGLKFYNSETHSAAFVLPQFAKQVRDCVVVFALNARIEIKKKVLNLLK